VAGQPGFDSRQRQSSFLFATKSRPALGPGNSPMKWVSGALCPGVKRPGREAYRSHPSSAEVMNKCSYTFTPPYVFIARYLVNHINNFAEAVC